LYSTGAAFDSLCVLIELQSGALIIDHSFFSRLYASNSLLNNVLMSGYA